MIAIIIGFAVIFLIGEVVAYFVFDLLRRRFDVFGNKPDLFSENEATSGRSPASEILKGLLERLVVTYGLFISLPGILTVFAALKLANRLTHEGDDSDNSKNYFLVGNLLTILFCLIYYQIAVEFADDIGAGILAQITQRGTT